MIASVQGIHGFRTGSDLTELAVRATTQARAGASAAVASAGRDKDGLSPSNGVRSKIAELTKTIEASPDRGATATSDRGASRRTTDRVEDTLRTLWSECLSAEMKNKEYNEKAINFSREKGEVWFYYPAEQDPGKRFYRIENQPEDFEAYMKLWEDAHKGSDANISRMTTMLASLDEPTPAQAGAPAKMDLTA